MTSFYLQAKLPYLLSEDGETVSWEMRTLLIVSSHPQLMKNTYPAILVFQQKESTTNDSEFSSFFRISSDKYAKYLDSHTKISLQVDISLISGLETKT